MATHGDDRCRLRQRGGAASLHLLLASGFPEIKVAEEIAGEEVAAPGRGRGMIRRRVVAPAAIGLELEW